MRLLAPMVAAAMKGQDLLEYGVLASLIALVALGAVGVLGDTFEQSLLAGHWSKHLTSSFSPRCAPGSARAAVIDIRRTADSERGLCRDRGRRFDAVDVRHQQHHGDVGARGARDRFSDDAAGTCVRRDRGWRREVVCGGGHVAGKRSHRHGVSVRRDRRRDTRGGRRDSAGTARTDDGTDGTTAWAAGHS